MKSIPFTIAISLSLLMISSTGYSARCVCYDTRTITRDEDGDSWVKYRGCHRSSQRCHYSDTNHFGCYSSHRSAKKALRRCRTGNPRFVD